LKLQVSAQRLRENNEQLKARMESLRNELVSANDNALRYEVAKDYLVDKVQSQEKQVDALKGVASEARSQHKATIATMIEQQRELEAAAKNSAGALRRALARNEALQAEGARMGAQLTQSQLDRAASEQRARGAKQAKDYLDGKLSATMEELKATRAEQRMALLKVEQALQLSLEESRILQQRDRKLRKQLKLVRKTAGEKADELRAQLAASGQSMAGLKVRINMFESTLAQVRERSTKQTAQTRTLRDEFAAKLSTAKSAIEAEATACAAARKAHATSVRDLKWRNESLRQRSGVLEDRVRVLEIAQSACKLHKTAL
jgi:chromosome segregation ATPase